MASFHLAKQHQSKIPETNGAFHCAEDSDWTMGILVSYASNMKLRVGAEGHGEILNNLSLTLPTEFGSEHCGKTFLFSSSREG